MSSDAEDFISDPIGAIASTTANIVTLGGYETYNQGRKAQKAAEAEIDKQKKEQEALLSKQKKEEETATRQSEANDVNNARLAAFRRRQNKRKTDGVISGQNTLGASSGSKNLLGV